MNREKLETECSVNSDNNAVQNGNGTNKNGNRKRSFTEMIQSFLNFFTVEPYLLCYLLANVISALAVEKLNLEKACRANLNYTEAICTKVIAGENDATSEEANQRSRMLVADMNAWIGSLQSALPAIMILFVGAWSDRTGNRKALMMVPLIGEFLSSFGLILANYYFLDWPLWATGVIEGIPPALFGGISIALMGAFSNIADVTTVESRTFRFGVVAIIVPLVSSLGSAISGILTQAVGYYGIFGIDMALFAIGFIHTYFRVHDVRKTKIEGTFCEKFIQFFHPRNVWETISLVVLSRGRKLAQVLLVIWAHIVIMGPVFGESRNKFLYINGQFAMNIVDYSLFSTFTVLMGIIGTAIAVTIFSKWLKMHDSIIGIIATISKVISSCVYGLAPTRNWLYSGPVFDIFGGSGVTAIRSLGTKVVDPLEVGKMCSLIGLIEAIIPSVYIPIYSKLYSNTLTTLPGAFYLLGGIMTIPDFVIFAILYILHKRQERDVVKNPPEKELHAHENAVTSL